MNFTKVARRVEGTINREGAFVQINMVFPF